jgi:ABC-type amino acid transport substrate-binding protein
MSPFIARRSLLGLLAASSVSPAVLSQTSMPVSGPVPVKVAVPGNLYARLERGQATGLFLETVEAVLGKMGRSASFVTMPTGDALGELTGGGIGLATVIVPTSRVRETLLLSAPVVSEFNVAVTLKGKSFPLARVADLRGKRIAARQGFQYPLLEQDPTLQMQRHATDGEMLRSLLFGASDVAIISGISDIYTFRSEGIMKRLEVLPSSLGAVPLVAAVSKAVFSKEDVDAFNAALAQFKLSSAWQETLESNGLADLVLDWPVVSAG